MSKEKKINEKMILYHGIITDVWQTFKKWCCRLATEDVVWDDLIQDFYAIEMKYARNHMAVSMCIDALDELSSLNKELKELGNGD